MNQSISNVAFDLSMYLVPVILTGALFVYLKTRGFSRACSDLSTRFWALSCAWYAFGEEYRRVFSMTQADLVRLEAERRQQRKLEPQVV